MLFNFITIGYTDNPAKPEETFFEGIHKLPAASRLFYSLHNHKLEIEKYWDIDTDEQNVKIKPEEAQEKFTSMLSASVKRRLRSDVKVGSSLSGGLDSSSIACFIQQHIADPSSFDCFTAHFPRL
ncbi:MAG: asparagine synthase-related protein [Chitinophagaceae bacterium]|nr:asparagine synthase-related protein [Chitinophagaceae bacterium]